MRRLALLLALPLFAACVRDGDAPAQDVQAAAAAGGHADAAATSQPALLAELAGTRWRLADGLPGHDPAEVEVTLAFDAQGRIGGNGGCNQYGADIRAADGRVHIGPVSATKRGCPGSRSQVEMAWLDALARVVRLERQGDALRLLGDDLSLRLVPAPGNP